jgi:uncharacterized OB-fold protein
MAARVFGIKTPIRLEYTYAAGRAPARFLRAIGEGRIVGQRCPVCAKVYVPPRGSCPTCGVATDEEVQVADTGTVTTFCIVNIPFAGATVKPPYVSASILLDGADIPLFHLVQDIDASEVRMGMRVRAVWAPRDEITTSMQSIRYFQPTGEPDAAFESYREHL